MHSRLIRRRIAFGQNLGKKMKRIELVIDPDALDRFTAAANDLNLSEFDVTEVRRTPHGDQP